jgi:hypothetical protein
MGGREAAAPEATKAATAAPRRITRTPTHGYAATREAAMTAFAKKLAAGMTKKRRTYDPASSATRS